MSFDYDYFVIGAGSGGVRSARIAGSHGAKVAIAEEYRLGGTCVIRGCVPKKMLFIGANFAEDLSEASRYGWSFEGKSFDWKTLRDNVLNDVTRISGAYSNTLTNNNVEVFNGRATITGPNRVSVNGQDITARHILVATGAKPFVPEIPGADLGLTSNEMFSLDELPRRIVIVGAGYIAMEFAGILNELGVDVTLMVRSDQILRGWDKVLVQKLQAISEEKGLKFLFNTQPQSVEKNGDVVTIHTENGTSVEADLLLWAVGRTPYSDGLGLEEVGIELGKNGVIPVDAHGHTALPWLHAVGDATDRIQLTPVAIREGHALADRLFGTRQWQVDYDCVPSAVFSHPPLATVGLTEEEAREKLGAVKVFSSDFRPMKYALSGRNERSHYRLIVDEATDQVVGAHMMGPEAPEILQALAIAVKAKLTKAQLDETIALHPTMAEELVLMR